MVGVVGVDLYISPREYTFGGIPALPPASDPPCFTPTTPTTGK